MESEHVMNVSEFSRLSGISRRNLIFYDEIGLFSPAVVGRNRYRYYTMRQLQSVGVIWSLREAGVPLKEVKTILETRTPARMLAVCAAEEKRIAEEMEKLERIMGMLRNIQSVTAEALRVRVREITVVEREEERLFVGPYIGKTDRYGFNDALTRFFDFCAEYGMIYSYPLGAVIGRESLVMKGDFSLQRFCYPAGAEVPDEMVAVKPRGRYVVGHGPGDHDAIGGLYRRLLRHIEKNDLRIAGDAYEVYVLNDITERDPARYLARLEIQVE